MAWRIDPGRSGARILDDAALRPVAVGSHVPPHAGWSDEALMLAIVRRDEAAFSALYDRHADLVYSTCLRVLADAHLAEDAVQDVFVRIWRRPGLFVAARGRFVSWLISVSRNRAVDELRARGRRQLHESPGQPDIILAAIPDETVPDPQRLAQLRDQQQAVRGALATLPADQRVALELAYFRGLTQTEIALALHEPLGTIKTRIRLGMHKLRSALDESASR